MLMLNKLTIRMLMTSVFALNTVLLIITLGFIFIFESTSNKLKVSNDRRLASYKLADEFRQGSDDLTRLARTYAVTGDSKYEKMYMDILSIRGGKKPRPQNYEQIYWDLVLNYGDKPKPDGKKIAILEAMQQLGFSDKEFALLDQAKKNSDDLVNMEVEAMNAVKGLFKDSNNKYSVKGEPNKPKAIKMLHSQAYHVAKAKIVKPVDDFFTQLEIRTKSEVVTLRKKSSMLELISGLMVLITLISSVLGYFVVRFKVLNPLSEMNNNIKTMAKDNNLTVRLDESTDEIGSVGRALNKLLTQMQEGIKRFIDAGTKMTTTAEQVTQFVGSAETKSREQNSQLTMVATAMEEMVATLKEVASSVNEASTQANQSEKSAQEGQQSMNQTNQVFEQLTQSFERSSNTITELSEESTNMSNVLDVIKGIAEQTNLLALNAAIEAARAGEQGRGFAVVADEVRTLAQRSQESAGEIEQMLGQLQTKAKDATASITQSAEDMNSTKTNIKTASDMLMGITQASSQINSLNISIATATEQQQSVSEDINTNISQLHEFSNQSVKEMQDFLAVANQLHQVAETTKGVTDQFKV